EDVGAEAVLLAEDVEQAQAEVAGEQFGGGVLDGQEDAVAAGEEPLAVAVADVDAARRLLDADQRVAGGQQHAVGQLGGQGGGVALQGDEVEDVVVVVEGALDLDGGAVVVAVEALALVALVADEVAGAEDEVVLDDADLEAFRHGRSPRGSQELPTPARAAPSP